MNATAAPKFAPWTDEEIESMSDPTLSAARFARSAKPVAGRRAVYPAVTTTTPAVAPTESAPLAVAVEDRDETMRLVNFLAGCAWSSFASSLVTQFRKYGKLSPKQLEAARSMKAKADAKATTTAAATATVRTLVTKPGMFRTPGGDVFKVQLSESGRCYAKRLVLAADSKDGKFVYEASAMRFLCESMRLTLDEAKEFGKVTGTCCCCGRELTNEASRNLGLGPICANKF